ncbi:MAG: nitric-oxide reductase large subunit, partial [Pseudomonadota bacterium]
MKNPVVRAIFLFLLVLVFGVLIFGGYMIKKNKPPIPEVSQSQSGEIIFTKKDIMDGQNYYYSRGGQHIGSIWGHGSYLAPDWSADYLHRLGLFLAARHLGLSAQQAKNFTQKDYEAIDPITKGTLNAKIQQEIRTNRFDPNSKMLALTDFQSEAFRYLTEYYTELFKNGNEGMGLQAGIVRSEHEGKIITSFFAWLAWAAGTIRPGTEATYTSNWPYDPMVGNTPLSG